MAIAHKSIIIPRASSLPSYPFSYPTSSSSSLCYVKLPEFRGLKVSSTRTIRSLSSLSKFIRRCSRIVNESSEAAIQLPSVTEETWKFFVLESDVPVMVSIDLGSMVWALSNSPASN